MLSLPAAALRLQLLRVYTFEVHTYISKAMHSLHLLNVYVYFIIRVSIHYAWIRLCGHISYVLAFLSRYS